MRAPHRIRRQRWQVGTPGLDTAFAVRQRLRHELDGTLLPAFEKAFDALAIGDEVIHIPRLELQLAVGDLEELAASLPTAIERALAQALSKNKPHDAAGAAQDAAQHGTPGVPARHSAKADRLAMLLHYLTNGNLGWAHAASAAVDTAFALRQTAAEWATDWNGVRYLAPSEPTTAFAFFFRLLQLLEEAAATQLIAAAAGAMPPGPQRPSHPIQSRTNGRRLSPRSAALGQHRHLCRQAALLALAAAPDDAARSSLKAYLGAEDTHDLPERLPRPEAETTPLGLQASAPPASNEASIMAVRGAVDAVPPGTVKAKAPEAVAGEESAPEASLAPSSLAHKARDGSPNKELPPAGTPPARGNWTGSHEGDNGLRSRGARRDTLPPAAPTAAPLASGGRPSARASGSARSAPPQAYARPWTTDPPPSEADAPALRLYAAGLVLLHPFLALLFRERALLADDEDCLPAGCLPRAAALLHWLATGRDEPYEFELGCIKVLLGLAPTTPLSVAEGLLDEADRAECTTLLDSALRHWSALGSTSIDGLRLSFLQRQGLLRNGETGWQLQFDPEPFDMLLARLPWGIGIVRLPWMTRPIFTDWPTP